MALDADEKENEENIDWLRQAAMPIEDSISEKNGHRRDAEIPGERSERIRVYAKNGVDGEIIRTLKEKSVVQVDVVGENSRILKKCIKDSILIRCPGEPQHRHSENEHRNGGNGYLIAPGKVFTGRNHCYPEYVGNGRWGTTISRSIVIWALAVQAESSAFKIIV